MQRIIVKQIPIVLLVWLLLACSVSANKYALVDNFPIPEKAFNIKKLVLAKNTHQLFFQIVEAYPSTQVIEMYREFLKRENWTYCPDLNEGWDSYEDRSSDNHLLVHKIVDYWVDTENSKLLILSAVYYSQDLSRTQPDNEKQHLVIWVQQTADLNSELSILGIKCGESTGADFK